MKKTPVKASKPSCIDCLDYEQGAKDMLVLYITRYHPGLFERVKAERIVEMMNLFRNTQDGDSDAPQD